MRLASYCINCSQAEKDALQYNISDSLPQKGFAVAETINILLIEDNPGDVRLTQEILTKNPTLSIQLILADTLSKGLKYIAAEKIHVVLLDLNLPDSEGIQTFRRVHSFAFEVPIIIMSILSDKELIFQAMKEGAQDYLIKEQLTNDAVISAIRYACWSHAPLDKGIKT